MTRRGELMWLALFRVAAAASFLAGAAAAGAEETGPTAEAPGPRAGVALDMTATGALGGAASEASAASPSTRAAESRDEADKAEIPFQPELPPEAGAEPPIVLASPSPPAAQPAFEAPHGDRPIAKLIGPPAPAGAAPVRATPADIEAAVGAMLRQEDKAAPLGARARRTRLAVGIFYFERGFAPFWTDENGFNRRAQAAIARLDRAGEDGLDLTAFAIPAADGGDWTAAQRARADVTLSQAIVAYAVQASGGRLEPSAISPQITARPDVAEPLKALTLVAAASDPDAALADFNPSQKGYRDLRDKLAELRAGDAPAAAIPSGPTLKIGMVDPRVALIRARFGLDAFAEGRSPGALVYDVQVAGAIADFQRANGLPASGLLTAGTVQALSGGAHSREEAAILANMEMWRWQPRDMGEERVEVNVPDFTLKVTRGEEVILRTRVIVGKPDTPTAIFSNQIKYLLINPAWNVPISIIKKEMLPKLAQDPDYLIRAGFEVTQKGDTLTVRQPPGERNALGHILFMFPNEHSIYLHDTPGRNLFAAQRRAFSHGCVRVDDPMRLGELVMGGAEAGWTQARLRSLVGATERTIFLPRPLAIHIEYFTAFVDDAGGLQRREDIYGFERRVTTALGLQGQG